MNYGENLIKLIIKKNTILFNKNTDGIENRRICFIQLEIFIF